MDYMICTSCKKHMNVDKFKFNEKLNRIHSTCIECSNRKKECYRNKKRDFNKSIDANYVDQVEDITKLFNVRCTSCKARRKLNQFKYNERKKTYNTTCIVCSSRKKSYVADTNIPQINITTKLVN